MSDIKTAFVDMERGADFAIESMLLSNDDGLGTALLLSLFTDRRAGDDDVLPPGVEDRRGVWMDTYADVPGDLMGSRLWLLQRAKLLPETVTRVREYCQEALDWMVLDGVAKSVQVVTWIERKTPIGVIGANIDIVKPDGTTSRFKFEKLWSVM